MKSIRPLLAIGLLMIVMGEYSIWPPSRMEPGSLIVWASLHTLILGVSLICASVVQRLTEQVNALKRQLDDRAGR